LGLESAVGLLGTAGLQEDEILKAICFNPRKIFSLDASINVGSSADITVFNPNTEKLFSDTDIKSKSSNSPVIGRLLKAEVIGTVLGNKFNINTK